MGSVSLRTIQRDIKTIGELFHIDIVCNSSGKYQIVSRGDMADDYESLLLNFELLSSIDSDITLQKYVISEHRRPAFNTNISDPVEEIVLKYDALDGAFVKTLPLHSSQEILSDTSDGLTVRLRLRITNDFVMALLSRSRSVEVVSPLHLRQRLHDVWAEALRRNGPAQSFKQPMGTT